MSTLNDYLTIHAQQVADYCIQSAERCSKTKGIARQSAIAEYIDTAMNLIQGVSELVTKAKRANIIEPKSATEIGRDMEELELLVRGIDLQRISLN